MHKDHECKVGREFLERYFSDGGLSEREEIAFREHYGDCDACLEEVLGRDPSALFSRLRHQTAAGDTEGLWPGIRSALEQKRSRPFMFMVKVPRYATAAAILLCLLAVGLYLARGPAEGPDGHPIIERPMHEEIYLSEIMRIEPSRTAAVFKPGVETYDFFVDDEEGNQIKFTMCLDRAMEENF